MRYNLRPRIHIKKTDKSLKNDKLWKKFSSYVSKSKCLVSATRIKNYLLKDGLLDLLKIRLKKRSSNNSNNNILCRKGILFEKNIITEIKKKVDVVEIIDEYDPDRNIEDISETLKYMMDGIPVIAQAPLYHTKSKTYGVADLLIRSDYVNKLIKESPLDADEEVTKAPKLKGDYHYIVIDIKWSSLPLCSNGKNIRNCDRYYCYKGQLAIYNIALGELQGYTPNKSYILGKGFSYTKTKNKKTQYFKSHNSFDKLGIINYKDFDNKYIDLTLEAVKWVRHVNDNHHNMTINPPSEKKLYPNMCNTYDNPFRKIKNKIAGDINEITSIWNVGVRNRDIAFDNNIYSWRDPKFTANLIGINGRRGEVIDKIININRDADEIISPTIIKNNTHNWKTKYPSEFFLDFEAINECFFDKDINVKYTKDESGVIYLIGLGYNRDNKWTFEHFIQKSYSKNEERDIIDNMFKRIIELSDGNDAKIYHWGHAEQSMLKRADYRHNNRWTRNIQNLIFIDMCKIFTEEPIVIKGLLNFGLKNVVKAMKDNNLIQTSWEGDITSGLQAMTDAANRYELSINDFDDIIRYNEIDCKVLWEILTYLRDNHT